MVTFILRVMIPCQIGVAVILALSIPFGFELTSAVAASTRSALKENERDKILTNFFLGWLHQAQQLAEERSLNDFSKKIYIPVTAKTVIYGSSAVKVKKIILGQTFNERDLWRAYHQILKREIEQKRFSGVKYKIVEEQLDLYFTLHAFEFEFRRNQINIPSIERDLQSIRTQLAIELGALLQASEETLTDIQKETRRRLLVDDRFIFVTLFEDLMGIAHYRMHHHQNNKLERSKFSNTVRLIELSSTAESKRTVSRVLDLIIDLTHKEHSSAFTADNQPLKRRYLPQSPDQKFKSVGEYVDYLRGVFECQKSLELM